MKISFQNISEVHRFLNEVRKAQIRIHHLTFEGQTLTCLVRWRDLKRFRKIRRPYRVKIELAQELSRPVLQPNGRTVLGILLLLMLPFLYQFYTWGMEVEAETIERQVEVEHLLKDIAFPIRTSVLPSEHMLRQGLLQQLEDVAWVHIEKAGAKLKVVVEEAPQIENEQVSSGRLLVAKQGGIVSHYKIESGVKQFALNDVVVKGDVLVTGEVVVGDGLRQVPVRGKVFVDFWRTVSFTMPRLLTYSEQGEIRWIMGRPAKNDAVLDTVLPWDWLPSQLNVHKVSKQVSHTVMLGEEHLDSTILPLLQQKTLATLSEDASIHSEKLLHVTFDNDTVKGQVLYLVNENVAVLSSSD